MPQMMRDKTVYCSDCAGTCYFTANLTNGKIVNAKMPTQCKRPGRCPDEHVRGIFDRRFGERILRPGDF